MAGLTIDQLSASFDARLDNNSENLILWSGSFEYKLQQLGDTSVLTNKVTNLSGSFNTLSASVSSNSSSFNGRINTIKASQTTLSSSVSTDVTDLNAIVDGLNDFSASITSSFNALSASVSSTSASVNGRINTIKASQTTLSASVNSDVTNLNAIVDGLNEFSASITSSLNTISASVSSNSASFSSRINSLKAGDGVFSSSAQLNNATIENLTITNLTTINETASVIYSSGSNIFGDSSNDTHTFIGGTTITGSLIVSGSGDALFLSGGQTVRLGRASLYTGTGAYDANVWLQGNQVGLSATKVVLDSNTIDVSGSMTISSSAAVDLKVIGALNVTGSLMVSSSNEINLYGPKLALYNPNTNGNPQFELNKYDVLLGGYYNFGIYNFGTSGTWISNGNQPLKIMTDDVITLSATNGNPGNVKVIGNQTISGSLTVSSSAAVDLNVIGSLQASDSILATGTIHPIKIWHGYGNDSDKKFNIAIGHNALGSNTSGTGNIALGRNALIGSSTGEGITAIGSDAGFYNTIAKQGTYLGKSAGYGTTTGDANTLLGYQAGYGISTGAYNTGVGMNTLFNNNGTYNTALGMNAGNYSSGSSNSNVYIGFQAGPPVATTESNKLYINNNSGNPLIGGDFSAQTVTISGSLLMSGSIIPAVGVGESTSSFSLGSATNAWKDIYVSNGTIKFMGSNGSTQGTLSSTAEGLSLPSITVAPAPGAANGNATINLNASANNASFVAHNAGGIARFSAGSDASYNYRINSYTGATFHGVALLIPTGSTRVVVGGATDDGANTLQVNGSARFQTNVSISGSLSNGSGVIASGDVSHAEGQNTIASGVLSHSEGLYTTASAAGTHAEGSTTWASGPYSHAEGIDTKTVGQGSHAEGTGSWAGGNYSHAEGYGTRANEDYELAIGKFNAETYNSSLFVIGNGTNDGNRSNIVAVTSTNFKVGGSITLVPQGAPSSPGSGSLYFSSADSHFYGWNGLVWKQLDN
jgi:hypothetical protein